MYHRSFDFPTPDLMSKQSKELGEPNLTIIIDPWPDPTAKIRHRLNLAADVHFGQASDSNRGPDLSSHFQQATVILPGRLKK